jgi:uncharacterized membrane protein
LGLSGAIIIVLESISSAFGINLYSKQIESIILTICSALVMLGIITKKDSSDNEISKEELLDEINKNKEE